MFTKSTLVSNLAAKFDGLTKPQANALVTALFDMIRTEVLHGEGRVAVHGFGVFKLTRRNARTARNPRTGASIEVPASAVVSFKASK
jgi:nucleoid DNA-binding protein